ncbi:hypothetical protein DFH06DRAFT_1173742 [Mycena polygramma]|nr:hypothetical protein DFH06DRAFT_1173742 [Mycena polygramma]
MHRGLQIPEIVEMVCEAAAVEECERANQANLASLARTCSFFFAPAVTVLWRQQDTIVNLLRCMPDGLWDVQERSGLNIYTTSVKLHMCLWRLGSLSFVFHGLGL